MTAQAIRVLLRALGTKQDARFNLKIVNNDGDEGASEGDKIGEEVEAEKDEELAEAEELTENSELAEKTRAELADLDDLDI